MSNLLESNNIRKFLTLVVDFDIKYGGDSLGIVWNYNGFIIPPDTNGDPVYYFDINGIAWQDYLQHIDKSFRNFANEIEYFSKMIRFDNTIKKDLETIVKTLSQTKIRIEGKGDEVIPSQRVSVDDVPQLDINFDVILKEDETYEYTYIDPPHAEAKRYREMHLQYLDDAIALCEKYLPSVGMMPYSDKYGSEFTEALTDLKNGLTNKVLIDRITPTAFHKVFTGKEIERKINWIGDLNLLNYLSTELFDKKILSGRGKNQTDWGGICKCFTHNDQNINPDNLRKNPKRGHRSKNDLRNEIDKLIKGLKKSLP